MELKNYYPVENGFWTGRIDDPGDLDSYRMHQVIELLNIANINEENIDQSKINFCFIGFCCDEGVRRNLGRTGAAKGPDKIRQEFANLPVTFSDDVLIYDAGNIFCVENNLEEAQRQLANALKILLDNNFFPLVLGGGHETALGNFNGITGHLGNGKAPSIISFDAHLDMRPFDKGGSSGTMFYQIADICKNENRPFDFLCVGTQTYGNTKSLFKRAETFRADYINAKDITEANIHNVENKITRHINKQDNVYITICADVFSSAYAPGVSALQPFGMNPEIVISFVKQIINSGKVICFDIAEVSPRFDHDNRTAKLAAVIFYAVINSRVELKIR